MSISLIKSSSALIASSLLEEDPRRDDDIQEMYHAVVHLQRGACMLVHVLLVRLHNDFLFAILLQFKLKYPQRRI